MISSSATASNDTGIPALKVLVIDSNPTLLEFIMKACDEYSYQAIPCSESLQAVSILQERKGCIDLILIEVHMPIVNGYEFLQFVNQEINVPVIMMSADNSTTSIMKAFKLGACDYWVKPFHDCRLKDMWIHVFRKPIGEDKKQKDFGSHKGDKKIRGISDSSEFASSSAERSNNNIREAHGVDDSKNNNTPSTKKNRVVWSTELHNIFVNAIENIGPENAVPKKILQAMNVPGLERGHVASHLQKYRKLLKSKQQIPQENDIDMSSVSVNTDPGMSASRTFHLEPFPVTTLTYHHPHLTGNTVVVEERSHPNHFHPNVADPNLQLADPNLQLADHFHQNMVDPNIQLADPNLQLVDLHAEQAMETPRRFCSVSNEELMFQINNMEQSSMHHHQIHPINFQSSSITVSENPKNYNLGMDIDYGENGEVILNQYAATASIDYPDDAGRSFAAASDFSIQHLSADMDYLSFSLERKDSL